MTSGKQSLVLIAIIALLAFAGAVFVSILWSGKPQPTGNPQAGQPVILDVGMQEPEPDDVDVIAFKSCTDIPQRIELDGTLTLRNEGTRGVSFSVGDAPLVAVAPEKVVKFGPSDAFVKGTGNYGYACIQSVDGKDETHQGVVVITEVAQESATVDASVLKKAVDTNELTLSACVPKHEVIRVTGNQDVTVRNTDAAAISLNVSGEKYTVPAKGSLVIQSKKFKTEGWGVFGYACSVAGQEVKSQSGVILIDRGDVLRGGE